jgi:hypothetical protein
VLAVAACAFFARLAYAHTTGLSSGRYVGRGATLEVTVSFARGEILSQCPELDRDHDTQVSPAELVKNEDCLHLPLTLKVVADGTPCAAGPVDAERSESDGVTMHVLYTCPAQPARFQVDDTWLTSFPTNHRHVARAEGVETRDTLLDSKSHVLEVAPTPSTSSVSSTSLSSRATSGPTAVISDKPHNFFGLGVEHILLGFDHLVFLFGLLLVPRAAGKKGIRALVYAITAFSVGHSVSLALAVSTIVTPSSRIVEPLIAASIAFVGLENVTGKALSRRWLLTLPFGFIHGFGFAEALKGIMPRGIGWPLLTFNLGVELGQLIAIAPMMGLIVTLETLGLATPKVARGASAIVLVFGVALFGERVIWP